MDDLLVRLEELQREFAEVENKLADPATASDPKQLADFGRRHSELRPILADGEALRAALTDAAEARELADVEDDKEMAEEFAKIAEQRSAQADELAEKIKLDLVPKDPNDKKDTIIEIRAAAGGDEAALWAGDLLRMYERYADRHGLASEVLSTSESEAGGFKDVTVAIKGPGAFGLTKWEAGVHRVQRVPKTESKGRVHTSTATVAVLPEADDVDVELDLSEAKVEVKRSSGPGGQSVNTTDSAVRLTHEPTGLVVQCQDEKSQLQNKEKAFRILRARLYQMQQEQQAAELADARRSQVGTGDRSEKIRTYNFKENRVTDHRIGLTIKQLPSILDGDLDAFIEELAARDIAGRLASDDG